MNRNTIAVIGIVAAVALFGGGYWAGANTATRPPGAAATTGTPGSGGAGGGGAAQLRGGGGAPFNAPITGRVLSVNADSVTIAVAARTAGSPQPGTSPVLSSSIALVGATTRVIRTSEQDIKLGDLKAGDQITVVGTTDQSNGTISAQAIVVGATNVLGQLFGGGGGPGGPGGQGGAPRPSGSPAAR